MSVNVTKVIKNPYQDVGKRFRYFYGRNVDESTKQAGSKRRVRVTLDFQSTLNT